MKIILILMAAGAIAAMVVACSRRAPAVSNTPFRMTVQNVFFIKTVERVIVTGVVSQGAVHAGDKLIVQTKAGPIAVVVEKLEHPKMTNMTEAVAGQDVGLMLSGIGKEQVAAGDEIVSKTGAANQAPEVTPRKLGEPQR